MNEKLKPCRDCGSEAEMIDLTFGFAVRCTKCNRRTIGAVTKQRVIEIWNMDAEVQDEQAN